MPEQLMSDMTFMERVTFAELVKNKGQVVTRERLAEVAGTRNYDPLFDRGVDVRVSRIRKHLVNRGSSHKILPVWGKGYALFDNSESA